MVNRRIFIGITGASGTVYAQRLVEKILSGDKIDKVYLTITASGLQVLQHELTNNELLREAIDKKNNPRIRIFANDDFFAPFASGSNAPDDMVVIPCSMGTLSRVAHGASSNLLERACDVVLKQKRRLILVPRETPLNVIQLQNMLTLAQLGVYIVPACPAFYHKPRQLNDVVNFVVDRVLDCLDYPHDGKRWNNRVIR